VIKGDAEHRKFAGRIRQVVAEFTNEGTVTALGRKAEARYRDRWPRLASKVRNWIPPIERWEWDKETEKWRPAHQLSKRTRDDDWNQLRFPQADSLFEFCELTDALPSHLLLGEGPRYRGENREDTVFEVELLARVRRGLAEKNVDLFLFDVAIAPHIRKLVSECVQRQLDVFQRAYELVRIGYADEGIPNPQDFF
jgi:hypothetical protein